MSDETVAPVGDPEPAPGQAEPVVKPAEKVALTDYIVLRQTEPGIWREEAKIVARSSEGAIREAAKKVGPDDAATLVAIPVRSFKAVVVRTKVTTSLVIEEAS